MRICVNNVILSYEKVGEGSPLMLVHGSGEDHRVFDRAVEILRKHFTCFLIDSRGHGGSSRVSEFHYRDMAVDMVEFMDRLNLSDVTYVGFSDGGIIGLMAAAMSSRIRRLFVCSANTVPHGLTEIFLYILKVINYFLRSPRLRLLIEEPDIQDWELQNITADTVVTAGSRDLIKRSHTDHIARQIPGAVEVILKGQTHTSYVVHSDLIARLVCSHLKLSDEPLPEAVRIR